ncbi:helix-turn-helix transcriptional regulator [Streptomyces sp. MH13]|uniref:helix-turn-helix transcriptional regulator n=1 Tax=Streptomyces sp. MH13 TaxID=3417651 RepID=UPI003CF0CF24
MLVERNGQIADLVAFTSGQSAGTVFGSSRTAVISGPVASGKTALLHRVLEDRALAEHGLLTAVGSPAERSIPFGVMEQLLHDPRQPATGSPPPLLTGAAGLGGLRTAGEPVATEVLQYFEAELGRMSARGPVLIAVDDVQYADAQSLQVLSYALRRFPSSGPEAVSVIVTIGAEVRRRPPGALEELLHPIQGLHVRVGPLSVAGVERLLVARARGGEPGEGPAGTAATARLAGALHAATGGNPLLVHGLVEDHFSHERPSAQPGDGAADGSPGAGERFLRSALLIVHRVGADGLRVAQGIALLGGVSPLSLLARLVEVEERAVLQVVSALADAGVLDGGRFRHAGVRTAVVESLDDEAVTRLRPRAARLLYKDGAPPLLVAEQLLGHAMTPPDEEWAPQVLADAAREAMAAQRVDFAVSCLRMAEGCCRSERERAQVRIALARFIWRVTPSAWPRQVRSLTGTVRAGQLPAADALRLVGDLLWNGWTDDAVTAVRHVAGTASPPDAELAAEVLWLRSVLASTFPGVLERVGTTLAPLHGSAAEVPVSRPNESRLAAAAALHGALVGGAGRDGGGGTSPAREDVRLSDTADRILAALRLTEETEPTVQACLLALVYADRLGTATQWADRLLAEVTARWPASSTAILRTVRAHMALRHGHLTQARRLVEEALEDLPPHCWGVGIGAPLSVLIEACTAMGDHEAAAEVVGRPVPEEMFATRYGLQYLYARGRHELETGRPHAALRDFTTCGRLMRRWGMDRSTLAPWRVGVAEASLALGSHDQVEHFAREQLTGDAGPRVRGIALHVLAAARPLGERAPLLSEAVSLLQSSGDRYELSRALTDLGQAHKQLGDPVQSKLHTRRAWRIAEGCGAHKLRQSLQSEQPGQAAPKAPEQPQPAATAGLTDAERRVASLAAQGYTNREIGAKLFITVSTVEQHLTRVYRKINISHRRDLPVSLDIDVAHIA